MQFGISDKSYGILLEVIQSFPEIKQAKIFGSRALGNYKKGSDIDIAVIGSNIDWNLVTKIHTKLNEGVDIPYYIDIIDYCNLNNNELKEHIDLNGKTIFHREYKERIRNNK